MKEETTSLQVALLAFSAKSYGGDSYIRAILPALERYGDGAEFSVLVRDDRYCEVVKDGRVRLVRMRAPTDGIARILWEQTILPRVLLRLGVDVVYTANNVGLLWFPKPCVIAIRNMEPLTSPTQGTPPSLRMRRLLLHILTRMSLRRATRIVAVSHFVKNALLSLSTDPGKIDVVYHGVDDLEETPSKSADNITPTTEYVASASKFVRYANLTTLIQAYARMRQLGFKGELRFAGGAHDAGYEREVRQLVNRLGLSGHVRFLGYIPRKDLQLLIRRCSVFIYPSKLEACPFTLLEALRQGAPIVTTNVGPMKEICGDAGVCIDPTDAVAFGDAAYAVATEWDLQQALRQKAMARSEIFRWEVSVSRLVETLKKAACAS